MSSAFCPKCDGEIFYVRRKGDLLLIICAKTGCNYEAQVYLGGSAQIDPLAAETPKESTQKESSSQAKEMGKVPPATELITSHDDIVTFIRKGSSNR